MVRILVGNNMHSTGQLLKIVALALLGAACAANLASVEDAELAEQQELLADNAADLEENEQDIDMQQLDDEQDLEDQQLQGQTQPLQDEDQQLQAQQIQNENQQLQDQQIQNENQQLSNQQSQNEQFINEQMQNISEPQSDADTDAQLLNEDMPTDNTVPAVMEAGDTVAAAAAEGIPPPNNFSGAPPIPGTLKELASGAAPEEYRIEAGDTLYDICEQLLGEPTYWPKLWALNDAIKNPHFVYPDFVLQFFPGDGNRPPAIRVVGIEELAPEGKLDSEALVAEETAKLFKGDDESDLELLNPEDIVVPPKVKELFRSDRILVTPDWVLLQLPAVILTEKPASVGEIVGSLDGALSIQDDEHGYVRGSQLESGSVYTVLRYREKIYDGSKLYGYRYDFISSVRVGEFTGEDGIARAQVFNSSSLTRAGDIIIEYRARSRRLPLAGLDSGSVTGRIVNLTHNGQQIGAMGDFAFLAADVGSDFAKNQILKIYKNIASRAQFSLTKVDSAYQIGTLQILDVTEQGAISYIISNSQEILLGDTTGS